MNEGEQDAPANEDTEKKRAGNDAKATFEGFQLVIAGIV
jgi:hypothetical protein